MSVVSPMGAGASDESRKAVNGWKALKEGKKRESRRERIARERREGTNQDPDNTTITADKKKQALLEAQKNAEQQIENPMKHLRESYKQKRKMEQNKKKMKLSSQKTLALLTEVTEKNGEILGVSEAGFDTYIVEFMI
ncbi:MAG: hypothetical protein ACOC56_02445 [Atribacterota bacterium]